MKGQMEMFPTPTGEQLRDRAFDLVKQKSGEWHDKAVMLSVFELERRPGWRVNGERLRHIVVDQIGDPPNGIGPAWGPVINDVIRLFPGLLIKAGLEKPKDGRSHASQKPTYIVNANWRGR